MAAAQQNGVTGHWFSPHPLSLEIQERYLALDQGDKVQAEYVWIGGNNELRCKTKVRATPPATGRPRGACCVRL